MRRTPKDRFARLESSADTNVHATLGMEQFAQRLCGGPLLPTQREFLFASDAARAYKGPAGCAKTSTICAAIFMRLLFKPGYRAVICRNDYNDLMGTTKRRMEEMLHRLPPGVLVEKTMAPPERWLIRPAIPLPDGREVLSELMFMGLKDYPGSYEFHGAAVDEANEVPGEHVLGLKSRLRAPGYGVNEIMLAFNPPDKHHWLYTACTGKNHEDREIEQPWLRLFEPQARENVANLPKDYYETTARGMPEDMRQRLIEGVWGSTFEGKPVYREFSTKFHVVDSIKFDPKHVLLRFWDFGYRRPACIWAQLDVEGRLKVMRELLGENEEIIPFARRVQAFTAEHFPYHKGTIDFGDPAVAQKKDTGQSLEALNSVGITMLYGYGNIEHGVRKIRLRLEQMVKGEPAMQFARDGVPILIRALSGGYRLDKSGQKPLKDGYYDHECFQGLTGVSTPTGTRRLDSLRPGDAVFCVGPDGAVVSGSITKAAQTSSAARVFRLTSGGRELVGTGNHPVLTHRGWVPLSKLGFYDIVMRHEPNNTVRDGAGVRWGEVLPVREVFLPSDKHEANASGVFAPRGVGNGRERDSSGAPRASPEREQGGQSAGEPDFDVGGRPRTAPPPWEEAEIAFRGPSHARSAASTDMEKEAILHETLPHLREAVRHALSPEGDVLRQGVQKGSLRGDASWVLDEVREEVAVFNLSVAPFNNFIAEGVVVHNCDAFRYGCDNILDVDGSLTPLPEADEPFAQVLPRGATSLHSVEYDPKADDFGISAEGFEPSGSGF